MLEFLAVSAYIVVMAISPLLVFKALHMLAVKRFMKH
jgi:hypothetical protein